MNEKVKENQTMDRDSAYKKAAEVDQLINKHIFPEPDNISIINQSNWPFILCYIRTIKTSLSLIEDTIDQQIKRRPSPF